MKLAIKSRLKTSAATDLLLTLARLNSDTDGSATSFLCKVLSKLPGIKIHSATHPILHKEENELEHHTQIHHVLQKTKSEAVLWGDIVRQKEKTFYHLFWTPQEILATNHPSGQFQPGVEFSLPLLQGNNLLPFLGLLIEIRRVESCLAGDAGKLKRSIEEARSAAANSAANWSDEDLAKLGFLMGYASQIAGWKAKESPLLNEAILIYQELAQRYTRENDPCLCAAIQSNLGYAYLALGIQESGICHLEAALDAYRNVMWERNREKEPVLWAAALNNYGYALTSLAGKENPDSSITSLEEAIDAFQEALQVYTHVRWPREWAMIQVNLGNAHLKLGERTFSSEHLQEAVRSFRNALLECSHRRIPMEWAMIQVSMGMTLIQLGEGDSDPEHFREAQEAFHEALHVFTREKDSVLCAEIPNPLAAMYKYIGGSETGDLETSLQTLRSNLLLYAERNTSLQPVEGTGSC